ncbi:MAG: Na/Pi cotransporter family protein [Bacillota bacterium]|jgi:phosphate:Na+ symporter
MSAVVGLVGGLGLFLYGMELMAEGLQKVAGDRLRRLLEILTSTPLIGVLIGALVTMLIQSSSATSVMVVGFVNAGLLTLKQAVSVILGANIGTTITAFMISLQLTDLALPAIGLGFGLHLLCRRRVGRYMGITVLGFGLLFLGMLIMGEAMVPLKESTTFTDLLLSFGRNPFLGVAVGTVLTGIVQSSSVTTGLVVTLASQGLIDLDSCVALVLGSNIGTTVTPLLAAIGAQLTAKRAAIANLIFKVSGVVLAMFVFRPFVSFAAMTHPDLPRQVANAHIIFNVANTAVLLPLIDHYVRLIQRIMPGEDQTEHFAPLYLDEHLLQTPSIALGQATREVVHMGEVALSALEDAYEAFHSNSGERLEAAARKESAINQLEQAIVNYLVKLSREPLSDKESSRLNALLNMTNDLERIGDHTENLAELASDRIEHRLPFSDEAIAELDQMYEKVHNLVSEAISIISSGDLIRAERVLAEERDIDVMEKSLRRQHVNRLNAGICFPASGIVYLDVISNLERIADHASNVGEELTGVHEEWEKASNQG